MITCCRAAASDHLDATVLLHAGQFLISFSSRRPTPATSRRAIPRSGSIPNASHSHFLCRGGLAARQLLRHTSVRHDRCFFVATSMPAAAFPLPARGASHHWFPADPRRPGLETATEPGHIHVPLLSGAYRLPAIVQA